MRTRIIIAIIVLIVFIGIINSVRKHKIDFRHALSWITCCVILEILNLFPQIIEELAYVMGIEVPVNMLFFFGIAVCLILIYGMAKTIANLADKVKKLTQELALLEKKNENGEEN